METVLSKKIEIVLPKQINIAVFIVSCVKIQIVNLVWFSGCKLMNCLTRLPTVRDEIEE